MKKFWLAIGFIITFLIIYLLQSNFFSWFTIAGIKPNLIIIFVLFIGLFTNRMYGLTFGVIFGLLWKKIKKNEYFPFGPALVVSFLSLLML